MKFADYPRKIFSFPNARDNLISISFAVIKQSRRQTGRAFALVVHGLKKRASQGADFPYDFPEFSRLCGLRRDETTRGPTRMDHVSS